MQASTGMRRVLVVTILGLLAYSGQARAISDEETYRQLPFRFGNPGARARALGGAYAAIADDAAGAQANPAGLYVLTRPEVYVEYLHAERDTEIDVTESGSLVVDPVTGERELPYLGVISVSDPEPFSEVAFAGLAWPLRLGPEGRPLSLSFSRQVVLAADRALSTPTLGTESRASFDSYPNTVQGSTVEAYSIPRSVRGNSTIDITHWNLGAALAVHPDFSFGVSVTLATLDIQADTLSQTDDPLGLVLDPGHPRLPAQPTTDTQQTLVNDTDESTAYTVGIHWHPDSITPGERSRWRLGAVAHKGASFSVPEAVLINGTVNQVFTNEIVEPDRFTLGASYRYAERWTFVAEYERIEYSDMLQGFRAGVNPLTSEAAAEGSFATDPNASITYTVDDADVPRLGVEYLRARSNLSELAFRVGYYRQPDSRIRMERFNATDPAVNEVYLAAFSAGQDEDHFTAGFGYAFANGATLEIAGDFSNTETQGVASFRYRWGRERPLPTP